MALEEIEVKNEEHDVCNDCHETYFYHLTEDAVRAYLRILVDHLDEMDSCMGLMPDEEWRGMLGMERSGI